MSERASEELRRILTTSIDDYSEKYQLNFLKFLTLSVVRYGLLEDCKDVFSVYETIRDSPIRKSEDYRVAVSLLRHFLEITGCKQAAKLSAHCCEEFNLTSYAPSVSSYQLLFCLACKLVKNENYNRLFESIDAKKLSKPKYDLLDVTSPVELFQSMICKESLHPGNPKLLKQEIVAILEDAQLEQELEFVQHYISHSDDEIAPLFDFEGHPISGEKEDIAVLVPTARSILLCSGTKKFPSDTEDTEDTEDTDEHKVMVHAYREENDITPLLKGQPKNDPEMVQRGDGQVLNGTHLSKSANRRHQSSSLKRKLAVCCVLFPIIMSGAVISLFVYATKSSNLSSKQLIYGYRRGPFVYSPFSYFDLFYYTSIQGEICGNNGDNYNLTVCATLCPLKVMTSSSQIKGGCNDDRFFNNCYVDFLGYKGDGINSQYFSQYMLTNSNMTFKITNLSQAEPVQLCVTTDNKTCGQIFLGSSMDCPEVLDFNQTNNYSQTFTAHVDSYYCAVWLIKQSNYSINYAASLNVVSYQLPPAECKNFYSNKFTLNLWHRYHRLKVAATHKRDVCILVQENVIYQDTTTLSITLVASSFKNLAFIFGVIIGIIIIIIIIVIIVTVVCYKYTCNKLVKPSSYCT